MKTEDGKRWRKRSWLHSLVSCFPSTESITLMNEPANPPERKRKKRHHHHLHHNNKSNIFLLPIFHLNNDIILFHTHIFMPFIFFLISFVGIVVAAQLVTVAVVVVAVVCRLACLCGSAKSQRTTKWKRPRITRRKKRKKKERWDGNNTTAEQQHPPRTNNNVEKSTVTGTNKTDKGVIASIYQQACI